MFVEVKRSECSRWQPITKKDKNIHSAKKRRTSRPAGSCCFAKTIAVAEPRCTEKLRCLFCRRLQHLKRFSKHRVFWRQRSRFRRRRCRLPACRRFLFVRAVIGSRYFLANHFRRRYALFQNRLAVGIIVTRNRQDQSPALATGAQPLLASPATAAFAPYIP